MRVVILLLGWFQGIEAAQNKRLFFYVYRNVCAHIQHVYDV